MLKSLSAEKLGAALCLLLALTALAMAVRPLGDEEVYWCLRGGRLIIETGQVADIDM